MVSIVHETASLGHKIVPSKVNEQHIMNSRSSSFSQSSQSSQTSQTSRKFRHYQELTVMDRPLAIKAIRDAISRGSAAELAELAQKNGLPPSLRSLAWPLLLKAHPFVLAAKEAPISDSNIISENEIPVTRIRGDIRRFRRNRHVDLQEDAIYEAIHSFLRKWGRKMDYDNAMVWIADYLISGDLPVADASSYSFTGGFRGPGSSINFTNSSGGSSRGSLTGSSSSSGDGVSPTQSSYGSPRMPQVWSFSADEGKREDQVFAGVRPDEFFEVFEDIMLIMSHKEPDFSEFVATMRQFLPELSVHFSHEGILSGSAAGDDWLIWWMRWLGIRVFPSFLVARLWDEYFSFRGGEKRNFHQQHLCTCILLMKEHYTRLLELDQSECRQYFFHMPMSMDTEVLVAEGRAMTVSRTAET